MKSRQFIIIVIRNTKIHSYIKSWIKYKSYSMFFLEISWDNLNWKSNLTEHVVPGPTSAMQYMPYCHLLSSFSFLILRVTNYGLTYFCLTWERLNVFFHLIFLPSMRNFHRNNFKMSHIHHYILLILFFFFLN